MKISLKKFTMSFFVSVVFFYVVHVISSNNNRSRVSGGNNNTFNNFSSDGYVRSEGTFFVNIFSFDGFFGGFDT